MKWVVNRYPAFESLVQDHSMQVRHVDKNLSKVRYVM